MHKVDKYEAPEGFIAIKAKGPCRDSRTSRCHFWGKGNCGYIACAAHERGDECDVVFVPDPEATSIKAELLEALEGMVELVEAWECSLRQKAGSCVSAHLVRARLVIAKAKAKGLK